MSLRMAELGKRLEHLPWLKSSVVRLDLPGRIVVEVVEREPMALVYIDGFQLVDREGRIFDRGAVDQYPGLLLVTGLNRSHVADGEVLKGRVMRVLTELLDALAQIQSWLPTQQISECHWQDGDGLVLHTVQGAFPIHLGFGNYAAKFAKLQRILVLLKNSEYAGTVTRIDLDYSNRAYIEGRFSTAKGI
jgi:cell division septal protein FtsQ